MSHKIASIAVVFMLALTFVVFQGCGQQGSSGGGDNTADRAMYIQDGAEKYFAHQASCPVCGGRPLRSDLHVDVNGKRVYFDKSECVDKFKNDRATYLEKLDEVKEQANKAYKKQ